MRVSPIDPYLVHSLLGIGYAFIELGRFDEAVVAFVRPPPLLPLVSDETSARRWAALIRACPIVGR